MHNEELESKKVRRERAERNLLRSGSGESLREWSIRADIKIHNMKEEIKGLKSDIQGNGKRGLKQEFLEHRAEVRSSVKTALVILGSLGGLNAIIALINLLGK